MSRAAEIIAAKDPKIESASEKLLSFLGLYISGVTKAQAWVEAGYSPNTQGEAAKVIRREYKLVDKLIEEKVGSQVPLALKIVEDLMQSEDVPPTVRLNAAKDILSRAGLDKPQEKKLTFDTHDMTDDAIDAELMARLQEVAVVAENAFD